MILNTQIQMSVIYDTRLYFFPISNYSPGAWKIVIMARVMKKDRTAEKRRKEEKLTIISYVTKGIGKQ